MAGREGCRFRQEANNISTTPRGAGACNGVPGISPELPAPHPSAPPADGLYALKGGAYGRGVVPAGHCLQQPQQRHPAGAEVLAVALQDVEGHAQQALPHVRLPLLLVNRLQGHQQHVLDVPLRQRHWRRRRHRRRRRHARSSGCDHCAAARRAPQVGGGCGGGRGSCRLSRGGAEGAGEDAVQGINRGASH
jgi:hypothetical protein